MEDQHRSGQSFSPQQRWTIALHVGISIVVLAAIFIMVNYLAARHFTRTQWNSNEQQQLSPLTGRVLDAVTNEVRVIVFYDRTSPLYGAVSDLLDLYRLRCPRIEVEYVDYVRYRDRAKIIQEQYKLDPNQPGDRVIFDVQGHPPQIVYAKDLSEFDYNAVFRGEEVRRTGFRGEQLFTSAIFRLIDPQSPIAYFLQGHGEPQPTDQDSQQGYYKFARILGENNVMLRPYLAEADVPSDCQLLIIAAPLTRLLPVTIERIERYLGQGGRLLVLFNYEGLLIRTGLERLLADWGVEVGHNYVIDRLRQKTGEEKLLILNQFGPHPIVDPLRRSGLATILPRSITPKPSAGQSANAPTIVELATTSDRGEAHVPTGTNRVRVAATGKIPIAVAIEKGSIQGISTDRGATRMVVVGDSYFLGNELIDVEGNRDFARNALNWLLNRELLLEGIGPRSIQDYRITMTRAEMQLLLWLFIGAAPGTAFLMGGIIWLRRRT